jgi:hypothetical protein
MLREIIEAQSAEVALYGLVTGSAYSAGMLTRHQWFASSGVNFMINACLQELFKTDLYFEEFRFLGCGTV